jgi:hypothetical protein
MNVLVFDANVSFARQAVKFILGRVKGADADMAENIFILRQRLKERKWDWILADVAAAMSIDSVLDELMEYQEKNRCPVVLWSTLTDTLAQRKGVVDKFQLIGKPTTEGEFNKALERVSVS